MTERIWALLDERDYCVGEVVLPARRRKPCARDTATPFVAAVRVDRRGDMMVEDIVVDHAEGIGSWTEHAPSRAHSDLLERLNRMDRAQFFDFIMAAVEQRT